MNIEEGKYYRTRSGLRAGPAERGSGYYGPDSWTLKVEEDFCSYLLDGRELDAEESPRDLAAEWIDETPSGDPAPKRLKIEAGKYYRTREGKRVGPLRYDPHTTTVYVWGLGESYPFWRDDGRFFGDDDSFLDIVAEWSDEIPSGGPEPDKYEPLRRVLDAAYEQAASGKGSARHSNGRPFLQQPILENTRQVGLAGPVFQVMKKAQEAVGMASRGETAAAKAELYGAIVYAAAAVLFLEETENDA